MLAGGVGLGFGVILFLILLFLLRRRLRLGRDGILVTGSIQSVDSKSVHSKNGTAVLVCHLTYTFADPKTNEAFVKSVYLTTANGKKNVAYLPNLPQGTPLFVVYLNKSNFKLL